MRFFICFLFVNFIEILQTTHVNIAFKQFTNMSSTDNVYYSYFAVDGAFETQLDGHVGNGIHTNYELRPWFLILFEKPYIFDTIRILNRDANIDRLTKLFIKTKLSPLRYVTDYSDVEFKTFAYMENSFGAAQSKTFQLAEPHFAQTIVFYLDKQGILTICEVEIYNLKSLAKGKPTDMLNFTNSIESSRAVDGHTNWYHDRAGLYCSHSKLLLHNWWRVNLEKKSVIYAISIVGRVGFNDRRKNFMMSLSDTEIIPTINPENVCGFIKGNVPIYSTTRCKKWTVGQYLTIIKTSETDTLPLTLCEVDVFGEHLENDMKFTVIFSNGTSYRLENFDKIQDCSGHVKQIINISKYKLEKFKLNLKGVGLKEYCENKSISSGVINSVSMELCHLENVIDGYFTDRNADDSCTYECFCPFGKCESFEIYYEQSIQFRTRIIYIFLNTN